MQLERFLSLIPGEKKKAGNGWMARCPAHDDGTPSLSIRESDDKILIKCFRGCTATEILAKLGLGFSDLYKQERSAGAVAPAKRAESAPKEVARYEYYVQDIGENDEPKWRLTGWKSRYYPKDFRWSMPDGTPGRAKERSLYNYKAIVDNFKDTIYLVEGEKDVDTLASIGAVATCSPDGCNSWDDSYTAALCGATVRIIPDNDEPGLKYAVMVSERLSEAGITNTIHPLTERGIKDVSDWNARCQSEGKSLTKAKLGGVPAKSVRAIKRMLTMKRHESEARAQFEDKGEKLIKRVDTALEEMDGESFFLRDIYGDVDAVTSAERRSVRAYLNRLATEGQLHKDKGISGRFCKPERELEYMDWDVADEKKSSIWLPLGIHDMVDIMPGNIIVLAGQGNAGKTTMALTVALENSRRGFPIYYFNSEMRSAELKKRICGDFGPEVSKEFKEIRFIERTSNFHEVIRPHALNIIDFLEIHTDFAEAGALYKKMHDSLGDGICLVCQQLRIYYGKDGKQYTGYGVGGEATAEKARLYMALTCDYTKREYEIEIKKAKMWPKGKENPNFKKIKFIRQDGEYIELKGPEDIYGKGGRWK